MDELKPCPFCGGKAKATKNMNGLKEVRVRIYCTKCQTTSNWAWLTEAIAAWNKRKEPIGEDKA